MLKTVKCAAALYEKVQKLHEFLRASFHTKPDDQKRLCALGSFPHEWTPIDSAQSLH